MENGGNDENNKESNLFVRKGMMLLQIKQNQMSFTRKTKSIPQYPGVTGDSVNNVVLLLSSFLRWRQFPRKLFNKVSEDVMKHRNL